MALSNTKVQGETDAEVGASITLVVAVSAMVGRPVPMANTPDHALSAYESEPYSWLPVPGLKMPTARAS